MKASIQIGRFTSTLIKVVLASAVLHAISACGSSSADRDPLSSSGVTVIGVTTKSGLKTAINRHLLANEFAEMLAQRQQFQVVPASLLRQTIGSGRVDEMLERYSNQARFAQRDIQLLMAAGLKTPYAVVARVEEDTIKKLPKRQEAMVGSNGATLVDRQRTILATQRTTQVSAILLDLRNGRELWNRHYLVDPIAETTSTTYHGNSFSGSLAAAFANTVVNGISVSRQPAAPPLRESLRSLLDEIANKLPIR